MRRNPQDSSIWFLRSGYGMIFFKHYVNDNNNFSVTSVTVSIRKPRIFESRDLPEYAPELGAARRHSLDRRFAVPLIGVRRVRASFISVPQFSLHRKHT